MSETTSSTNSSAGKLEGAIPLTEVTGETSDISEYLVLDFMTKFGLKTTQGSQLLNPFFGWEFLIALDA